MKVMNGGGRPAEILLVEDNHDDVLLTREGFERAHLTVNLHHVENGEECMAFLRKEREYANVPTPDLVLLDLNMPVMDGREVLAELVKDDDLNHFADRDFDDFRKRPGCAAGLQDALQRLHDQAGRFRQVPERRPGHRRLLVHGRHLAPEAAVTNSCRFRIHKKRTIELIRSDFVEATA